MFNFSGDSNPTLIANEVAKKYNTRGYNFDFSLQSLEEEIDKVINNPKTYQEIPNIETLKADLSVYIGETFCKLFNATCVGQYFSAESGRSGVNFYTYFIEKEKERFHPYHFFEYRLVGLDTTKNNFKEYLHFKHSTIGNRKIVAPGVLFKFLKTPDTLEVQNPKKVAAQTAKKYSSKGYTLDFSLLSLQTQVDRILTNEISSIEEDNYILEAELTAYFGETVCKLYNFSWQGIYDYFNIGANFYTCKIIKAGIEISPSHFISYYITNGKKDEGTFQSYINRLLSEIKKN